jgi:hypothetical protein
MDDFIVPLYAEWRFDHMANTTSPLFILVGEGSDAVNRLELKQEIMRQFRHKTSIEMIFCRGQCLNNVDPNTIVYIASSHLLGCSWEELEIIFFHSHIPIILDIDDIVSEPIVRLIKHINIANSYIFLLPPFHPSSSKKILFAYLSLGHYWNMNFISFQYSLEHLSKSVSGKYQALCGSIQQSHQPVTLLYQHNLCSFPYRGKSALFRWRRLKRKLKLLFCLHSRRCKLCLPTDLVYLMLRYVS